jgi:hypothetical protein
VGGNIERADQKVVGRGVKRLRASGKKVCTVYRIRSGQRESDPTIAAQFEFVGRLHGGDAVRFMWGGGGITVAGWLHDDSREALLHVRTTRPLDVRSVGRLDSFPLPVALKVEFVAVTKAEVVQFEQFHPRAGPITMETSSVEWLEACPGGWRGETPIDASWGAHWPAGTCIAFRREEPAKLPDAWRSDPHLSVAVRAKDKPAVDVDVTLRYTAVDTSAQCFVAGAERLCQPMHLTVPPAGNQSRPTQLAQLRVLPPPIPET